MITDTRDTCALKAAIDEHETCPGEPCPFWRGDECVIAGLHSDLATTAGLPELLLRIREDLGARSPRSYGLVPPGLQVNGGSIFDRVVCGVDRSDAGIAAAQVAGRVAAPVGSLTVVAVGDSSIAVHAGWAMPARGPEPRARRAMTHACKHCNRRRVP